LHSISDINKQIGCRLLRLSRHDDEEGRGSGKIDEFRLSQTFQRALILQRSGDRSGALKAYQDFLKVAEMHDVDPMLYAEVYANMGAVYAMQGKGDIDYDTKLEMRTKAKSAFQMAVQYRPGLGTAWVNLALIMLAEGKEMGGSDDVGKILQEARSCCVRALGMDNEDDRSRALANKLVNDIDTMIKQTKA
jgi:tetratricopeptide (TPR) repeat protein